MILLLLSLAGILGAEYYLLGTVLISNNIIVSIVINIVAAVILASMFSPMSEMTSSIMDADIRSNK